LHSTHITFTAAARKWLPGTRSHFAIGRFPSSLVQGIAGSIWPPEVPSKKSEKFNALEQHQTQLRLKNTGA